MEILYQDRRVFVVIKPPGVRSTNEPGGMPELIRQALGDSAACVRQVHRLDQVVGGVMVYARSVEAARRLSAQMEGRQLHKEYLAVIHGAPLEKQGVLQDLLGRDRKARKTFVAEKPGKDIQEARLSYQILEEKEGMSLAAIALHTGRTHQIRVQFSSRGLPLVGDKKYGWPDQAAEIALWSHRLGFCHPETGVWMEFSAPPPEVFPWTCFSQESFG